MKKISKILVLVLLIFNLGIYFQAQAVNTHLNCQSGVCTSISDDLPDGSTGIDPNKTVNLSFSVYQKDSTEPPVCDNGRQLFHTVRHNIDGQADVWDYYAAGSGQDIEYQFNSGAYGQRNRYSGVFYCWTKVVVGDDQTQYTSNANFIQQKKYSSDLLGSLPSGQLWLTPELNLLTRNIPTPKPTTTGTKTTVQNNQKKTSLDFPNPLRSSDLNQMLTNIYNWIFYLAIPIAVAVIVISGIMMLASQGDPGKFGTAKKMLLWAVIGLAVLFIGSGFTKLIESIINLKNR